MADLDKARALLREFRGDAYLFGQGALSPIGPRARRLGDAAALVRGTFPGSDAHVDEITRSLGDAGVSLVSVVKGARPNAPKDDVIRIAAALGQAEPKVVVSFGGGSTIDATKAADVLRVLGGDIGDYFGTGQVTRALRAGGKALAPHVAVQTVASSAAHLTKYANVTDPSTGQKKLIVDEAIVPSAPVFDYTVARSTPRELTADGAFDGLSHLLEVLYGAVGQPHYEKAADIAATGLALIVEYLPRAMAEPTDVKAREALCLATDLGGYAIMIGGTNGGHLTSFSLVDILPHGRACAILNPYYTVFFAPAIEEPLRLVGGLYRGAGFMEAHAERLRGRELGVAVANAMFAFAQRVGFPTRLADVDGFSDAHIDRALTAAKDRQLKMKLQNMPVPLTTETVDRYMAGVLQAARDGDLTLIENVC